MGFNNFLIMPPAYYKYGDDEVINFYSRIISEINEYFGKTPEGTEDGTRKLIKDIVNDDEFKSVIKSNNTDSNKRDKLQEIIGNKNIKTLDINHKLYELI